MLAKTWNVNLRIMFDLPRDTYCWIVEALSGGRHLVQMVYSRFMKYMNCLYNVVKDDVRTTTGSNIRTIQLATAVDPRYMERHLLKNWLVYPPKDDWTVPLLISLLEMRSDNWEVIFDQEEECLQNDAIDFIIEAVCTG